MLNAGIDGEPVEPSGNRYVDGDEVLLPRFGPRTNLSFVLQSGGSTGESNLLPVLAAPDTDRIEFTGCAGTAVVTRAADADTLQADVGPLDAPGRLRLLDGGDLRYDGAPLAARYLVRPR